MNSSYISYEELRRQVSLTDPAMLRLSAKATKLVKGYRLADYRIENHLSRRILAKRLGVPVVLLPFIERGWYSDRLAAKFKSQIEQIEAAIRARAFAEFEEKHCS